MHTHFRHLWTYSTFDLQSIALTLRVGTVPDLIVECHTYVPGWRRLQIHTHTPATLWGGNASRISWIWHCGISFVCVRVVCTLIRATLTQILCTHTHTHTHTHTQTRNSYMEYIFVLIVKVLPQGRFLGLLPFLFGDHFA